MTLRLAALLCTAVLPALAAEDALAIMQRSLNAQNASWERARNYRFQQREEQRRRDEKGGITSRESKTYEVSILYGKPYRRLVAKDDKPLPANEAQREQAKLDKEARERAKQTGGLSSMNDYDKDREEQKKMMAEIPKAFTFSLAGEETISGRPVYIIQAEPKPGYEPNNQRTKLFPNIRAKLWVDKGDYQWVKADIDVIKPVSFGWVLAKLNPGAQIHIRQTRINNEVWLPERFALNFDVKLAMVKRILGEVEVTYSDYKKFQTESRVVPESVKQ